MTDTTNGNRKSLSHYYNASQYRIDTWNRLKSLAHQLANDPDKAERHGSSVRDLIAYLAPIEVYWAFPGPQLMQQLSRDEESGDFSILSTRITCVTNALMSGAYKRKHIVAISNSIS